MSEENLNELRSVIALEQNAPGIVLDLKDVTLVDREVVQFLEQCETYKVTLRNCPAYIRAWIDGNRKQKVRRRK